MKYFVSKISIFKKWLIRKYCQASRQWKSSLLFTAEKIKCCDVIVNEEMLTQSSDHLLPENQVLDQFNYIWFLHRSYVVRFSPCDSVSYFWQRIDAILCLTWWISSVFWVCYCKEAIQNNCKWSGVSELQLGLQQNASSFKIIGYGSEKIRSIEKIVSVKESLFKKVFNFTCTQIIKIIQAF